MAKLIPKTYVETNEEILTFSMGARFAKAFFFSNAFPGK